MAEDAKDKFFLQYYFPPSSVGETGRVGAPGRREIGHGQLAQRALMPIIPQEVSRALHASHVQAAVKAEKALLILAPILLYHHAAHPFQIALRKGLDSQCSPAVSCGPQSG